MKNDLGFKRTSLSTSKDVVDTLTYKMNSLTEQDLPIQEGLSDYIGLSFAEIDAQRSQLKAVKQEVSERDKELQEQSKLIKEKGAEFFNDYGIEKMVGAFVSSITVTKGKPASSKLVFKLLVDKKASEAFLVDAGLGVYESVIVPETADTLRVNRRKIALAEVEE